jgi:transposase-like protein
MRRRRNNNTSAKAPETLFEFIRMFPDDTACRDFLARVRWPQGLFCPECGESMRWISTRPEVAQCRNRHQTSLKAGTVMHKSKQSLLTWFTAAFLAATLTPGISALQLQKQLGVKRYETAFQLMHKLRSGLVDPSREPLKGEVEIDEAFVGGKEEGRPGRGAETKTLIIVAVEILRYDAPDPKDRANKDAAIEKKRAGRVRMSVIPDASANTLIPWVQKNVAFGATIYTDGWTGYNGLTSAGYVHRRVMQSHKGASTGRYLPLVHLMISNLKRNLLGTYKGAWSPKHLPAYLNEFTYRFNRRFWRGPSFLRLLGLSANVSRWPEYKTLYRAGKSGGWVHPNPKRTRIKS